MKAAFVLIQTELGRVSEVASRLIEIAEVSEVHSVTGTHDLLVKLYAPDYDAFAALVPCKIQRIPGVKETLTLLAFQAYK